MRIKITLNESTDLGKVIREARVQKGRTSAELALSTRITPTYLSMLETGKKTPSIDMFINILKELRVQAIIEIDTK